MTYEKLNVPDEIRNGHAVMRKGGRSMGKVVALIVSALVLWWVNPTPAEVNKVILLLLVCVYLEFQDLVIQLKG